MNATTKRAKEIFLEAVKIAPDRWDAYLVQACAGDEDLRRLVSDLLGAHKDAGSFLDSPAPALAPTVDGPISERPGSVVGPYKLMEQIGEGGMGLVFVAEQQQPVRRKVALKVIKPGMDTRQVVARFEAERQALALMDHPNIAKVLDGGRTASGRPYFVMELVKGVPITEYCDQNQVPVRERLELFVWVCQAVQHAHLKGIIHRDLKPSNVLVMSQDGTPVVKVIDFGVAKAIGQQLTDKTIYTQFDQLVGTPLYMSPEQAGQSSVDVDTRTDIYALGVLLYELLTGTTPFDRERLKDASYDEIRRIIREEEPPRPSTRISTLGQAATTVSTQRQSDPKRLSRLVRGELDWIVMKCLEKDRNRRYQTANGLAHDIERYLHDEPVQACPPSACYRLRKFVRRNKGPVLAAVFLLLAVWGGTAGTSLAAYWLREERNATRIQLRETEKAQREGRLQLYRARLGEAKASRWSGRIGQRFQSLEALTEAAQIARELELGEAEMLVLRNEAIACLTLPDMRLVKSWDGFPPGSAVVALDPAFKHYARSDLKGNISVRRIEDDQEVAALPGPGTHAYWLRFSPDGHFLATIHHQTWKSFVWDLVSGKAVMNRASSSVVLAFSPDSRRVAVGAGGGGVALIDLLSGKEEKKFAVGEGATGCAFEPHGRHLAVATAANPTYVRVYDLNSDKVRHIYLPQHPLRRPGLESLCWSADGALLISHRDDDVPCVIDPHHGELQSVLRLQDAAPSIFQFDPTGDLLASAGWNDFALRLWDPWAGRHLLSKSVGGTMPQFSPDGRLTCSINGSKVELWEIATGREARRNINIPWKEGRVANSAEFSSDARFLALAVADGVSLCDRKTNREIAFLPSQGPHARRTHRAVFHPLDGSLFAFTEDGLYRWPFKLEPVPFGRRLEIGPAQLRGERVDTHQGSFRQDGSLFAVSDHTRGLAMVTALDGERSNSVSVPHKAVAYVDLSPDGQWLATGTWWGLVGAGVRIWEARSGKPVYDLPRGAVAADATVTFSPDGQWLVTATGTDYRFWKVGSWEAGPVLPRSAIPGGQALAFTHDGKMLAVNQAPNQVKLVEVSTGNELASLPVDAPSVIHLRFSPDDTQLALCAGEYPAKLWDLRCLRKELATMGLDWSAPSYPPAEPDTRPPIAGVKVHSDEAPHKLPLTAYDWTKLAWELVSKPNVNAADAKKAVELATRGVEMLPESASAWRALGVAQYRSGNWQAATTALEKSMSLQGANDYDLLFLAMTNWRLGQQKEARRLFERACQYWHRSQPLDVELRHFVAVLLGCEDIPVGK
jgi:serine/threonine protein kinase/WD40 repeat protein